jgi:LPXTG-motif cell wall-anchored protein
MVRTLFMSAALMLAANVASAQITTYIAPPRPLAPSPLAVAAGDSARKDSVGQAAIKNMKAWVDSAAGVAVPARVGADSLAVVTDTSRQVTTTFSNGSVAPATASDLPTLAIAGLAVLALGVVLLRNRQRG